MLYKEDIVAEVSALTGFSKKETRECIDTVLETIIRKLSEGESIKFTGFGTFEMRRRLPRVGRNPHLGVNVPIPARMVPYFESGKRLKELIVDVDDPYK